jgi:hypothetical protein
VSGFVELLTALGAEPSIAIAWTIPVSPPAAGGGPSPAAGGGPLGAGAPPPPAISGPSITPSRFRRGRHAAAVSRRAVVPIGTTVSFALTQAATATLAFEQAHAGVRAGARCLGASRSHSHGKPCVRWVALAHTVVRQANAGADRIHFEGVLDGGARLAPGRYRLALRAANAAGSARAARRPEFTLLP